MTNTLRRNNGTIVIQGESTLHELLCRAATEGRDLSFADLSMQQLKGITLTNAQMYGADLSMSNWNGSRLTDTNLASSVLIGTQFRGCCFTGCDLSNSTITAADFSGSIFDRCIITGMKFEDSLSPEINLEDCFIAEPIRLFPLNDSIVEFSN